jgi:hypothetical protein
MSPESAHPLGWLEGGIAVGFPRLDVPFVRSSETLVKYGSIRLHDQ